MGEIFAHVNLYILLMSTFVISKNRYGNHKTELDIISFDRWSMTNVEQHSRLCWYHLIGIYLLSAITIYFLEKEFIIYAKYRHIFLRQVCCSLQCA